VLIKAINDAYNTLVKVSDFSELKAITAELADAQKRTEQKLEKLIEAFDRIEQILQKMVVGLDEIHQEVGWPSRSVSYGFENEA